MLQRWMAIQLLGNSLSTVWSLRSSHLGFRPAIPSIALIYYGCGSKPMGSHFGVGAPPILEPILVGLGCSPGVRAFDPWPYTSCCGFNFILWESSVMVCWRASLFIANVTALKSVACFWRVSKHCKLFPVPGVKYGIQPKPSGVPLCC